MKTNHSENQAIDLADQIKNLRETNRMLIKALEGAWENRAFLPIKERDKIKFALERAKL